MAKKKNKNVKITNTILLSLLVVAHIIVVFALFSAKSYAQLDASLFTYAIAVVIAILITFDLISFYSYKYRDEIVKFVVIGLFAVTSVVAGMGAISLSKVNTSIDEIIEGSGEVQYEDVVVSFVTYNNEAIHSLSDLKNKKIGSLETLEVNDIPHLGSSLLETEGVSVTYKYYTTYNDLLMGLIKGEVETAIMPGSFYSSFSANEGYEEYLEDTNVIHSFMTKVEMAKNESLNIDITEEPFTLLLVGYAGESKDGSKDYLSDALIYITVNPQTMSATLTSIPRDSYVPIACYSGQAKDKLTHARPVSRSCMIQSIENLFDEPIDFYFEIDFNGVVDIVDALDGVIINSPVEFVGQTSSTDRGEYTVFVPKGEYKADGEQALAYIRERKNMPNGDFDRQVHQQEVIMQIMERTLALDNVNSALDVLSAAEGNIKTNMSIDQMVQMMKYIKSLKVSSKLTTTQLIYMSNSRVTGYGTTIYNDSMAMPLWALKPWVGSIEDNKAIIKSNLGSSEVQGQRYDFGFNVAFPYFKSLNFKEVYPEKEVHDPLPDMVPAMKDNWTLEQAQEWANSRGIQLVVQEIRTGNASYNAGYPHNTIVSQSVRSGIKTDKVSKLEISVIKHELDCSNEANHCYAECKDIVPDFVGKKLDDFIKWANTNGVTYSIKEITSDMQGYDGSKIGIVTAQDPVKFTKLDKVGYKVTVTTMAYPTIVIPKMVQEAWTNTKVIEWATANLTSKDNVIITRISSDTVAKDVVISVNPTEGKSIKTNAKIEVVISLGAEPSVLVADFANKDLSELAAFATANNLKLEISYKEEATTDPTLDGKEGKIVSNTTGKVKHSVPINVVVVKYKYTAPEVPTPPDPTTPETGGGGAGA